MQKAFLVDFELKCFAPVDKYHRNFAGKLGDQTRIRINLYDLTNEIGTQMETRQRLLCILTQVTTIAGV